jgi:hypothetical protein
MTYPLSNDSVVAPVSPESPPQPFPYVPLLVTTLLYVFLFTLVASTQFMPFLRRWGHNSASLWIGFALSIGPFMVLQLLLVRYLAACRSSFWIRLGFVLLAGLLWTLLLELESSADGPAGMVLGALLGPWVNLALIFTTVMTGTLIAYAIREAAVLLPVLMVSALVDYWGVYYGTTHFFVKHAPRVVEKVSAKAPVISFGGIPQPAPTIGPGDFVFLGIFFACLYQFDLHVTRTFWAFTALLFVALVLVFIYPIPIPGLVPMAIAMVLVNGRRLKLSRSEVFATIYVVAALAALLAALTVWGPFRPGA